MPAIGPLSILHDPNTGQLQNISVIGLPIGLDVEYEKGPGHVTPPPIQLSGATGDVDIIETPGGPNIETITLTGPIGAEAVYADNAGGSTNSTANAANIEHATLLQGFDARGIESLSVTGPENVDATWGAPSPPPTSSADAAGSSVDLAHGPGGGGLSSISTSGLLGSDLAIGDTADQSSPASFPIEADQDPAHASLLAHLNDRGIESASVDGIGNIADHSSDAPSSGGALDLPALGNLGSLPELGDLGHLDHILG